MLPRNFSLWKSVGAGESALLWRRLWIVWAGSADADGGSYGGVPADRADVLPRRCQGAISSGCRWQLLLIHEPQILFLDEPTSGIDPLARRRFWQQITDLSLRGTTIIITTHFMEEAEYCDRFMIQDHGQLLVLGSPQSVREQMSMPREDMNEIFLAIVENHRAQEG